MASPVTATESEVARFESFAAFFPYYLREHSNPLNRWLHFLGTSLALLTLLYALASASYSLIALSPVMGYGLAWVGHFFIEKNRPASFKYPLWSLIGDFKMYGLMLTGKV